VLWRRLEEESGQKLLNITGGVYIGRAGSELVTGSHGSAKRHNLDHEYLDHAQLARRFPQFQLPDDYVALYEPMAGWLPPEQVVAALAERALRRGARLQAYEAVRAWSADQSGVSVTTDRARYHADKLIICGGPWSGTLLRDLRIQLTVTRQVMAWVWPKRPARFAEGSLPVWAVGHDDGTLHYGFPMSRGDGGAGLKLAHHARGPATDPDRVAREPTEGDERNVRDFLDRFMPDAEGPVLAQRVCLYTNSPDAHFIVDESPRHPGRVILACGFSGHGFKFASVIGEVLADLATRGASDLPIDFLSLRRFA
jgi:sarcosine oxidase